MKKKPIGKLTIFGGQIKDEQGEVVLLYGSPSSAGAAFNRAVDTIRALVDAHNRQVEHARQNGTKGGRPVGSAAPRQPDSPQTKEKKARAQQIRRAREKDATLNSDDQK